MQGKSEYLDKVNTVIAVYKINTKSTDEELAKRLGISKYKLRERKSGSTDWRLSELERLGVVTGNKLVLFE